MIDGSLIGCDRTLLGMLSNATRPELSTLNNTVRSSALVAPFLVAPFPPLVTRNGATKNGATRPEHGSFQCAHARHILVFIATPRPAD
jgi:hypothetical protein